MADTLDYPPFPPLIWDHYFWVADLKLPSWAGFDASHGETRKARAKTRRPTDGTARLAVSAVDIDARTHPTVEQVVAFQHLENNESAVAEAVAHALVRYCPGNAYDGDDEVFGAVCTVDDLRPLVRLAGVHVLNVVQSGVACVGFEFDCAWDREHGAGVMTYLGRVIATGQADCSFTEWIARDGLARRK